MAAPEVLREFVRDEKDVGKDLAFCFCGHCGCVTHWWGIADNPKRKGPIAKMGVNCRMLPEADIKDVERHITYV